MARATFAGVYDKFGNGLAQELAHRPARHLISHIKCINVYYLTRIFLYFRWATFTV
jgi:hypothetical protein